MEKWKEFQKLYVTWVEYKAKTPFYVLQSVENLECIYSEAEKDKADCWDEFENFLFNNVLGKISFIKEAMTYDGIFKFELENVEVSYGNILIKGYITEEVEYEDDTPINFLINHRFKIKEFVELLEK